MAMGTNGFGQKVKPTSSTSTAGYTTGPTINLAEREKAYDADEASFTNIETPDFSMIVSYSPHLNLIYSAPVPANKDFYMKLNFKDAQLLDNIAGGYVGGLLNNVVSGLLGGVPENYFTFKNGTTAIFEGKTHSYSRTDATKMRLVRDGYGNNYFKFSLGQSFDQVSVRSQLGGLITTPSKWIRVYDTYYYGDGSKCLPILTYSEVADDLLSLAGNNNGINNSHLAIDNSLETYSSFGNQSLLSLGLGVNMEQFFELPGITSQKSVRIRMQMPQGLLDVGVASGIEIVFYNGATELSSKVIDTSVIDLDLLGLINSGNNQPFSFFATPPMDSSGNVLDFNKVSVRVKKPISVEVLNITGDLQIYDVAIIDATPEQKTACIKYFDETDGKVPKFDITQIIPGFNTLNLADYIIIDEKQNQISLTNSNIDVNKWQRFGTYYIKGITDTNYCFDEYASFSIAQDKTFKINGKSAYGIQQGSSVTFDPLLYTTTLPTGSTIKIFDELTGEEVTGQTFNFPNLGSYNYYAQTINAAGTCEVIKKLTVFVYDINTCDYRYIQKHATDVMDWNTVSLLGIPLGAISNRENAGDNDLSTHSTITNVVSLLGIGTTWQDIKFDRAIAAGTPVTLKLGQEYSLLQLIGAISLRPINSSGAATGSFVDVGETDLLNALVGDNVFEFTFVPKDASGENIDYSGVRVHLGSVLGVGNSMNVFGAYIDERLPLSSTTCEPNIVVNGAAIPNNLNGTVTLNSSTGDVLWGVEDIGIGAATAISGVVYPYLAADNDLETFAEINQAASLLNAQTLTIKFKEIARPGDKVRVIMGKTNVGVLDLSVLGGFTIQKYLGDVAVGDPLNPSDFSLIDLNLLGLLGPNNSSKFSFIMNESNVPFDRVELRFTNIINVQLLGSYPKVYDVSLVPFLSFDSFEEGSSLCANKKMVVEKIDICTEYSLSFATPVLDVDGAVTEWTDIAGSNFIENIVGVNEDYSFSIPNSPAMLALYNQAINSTGLYIKIVTMRQECQYGDIQYLRVGGIENCSSKSIANPMIRSRLKNN